MHMHSVDMHERVHIRKVVRMERSPGPHAQMLCFSNA